MKRNKLNRIVSLILTAILVLSLFAGCSGDSYEKLATPVPAVSTSADTPVTLWVVTEKTQKYGMMNHLLEEIVEVYGETNKNVTFEIEYLPDDASEREIKLESIRAEIMAGNGPDVYLLPSKLLGYQRLNGMDELFSDVELSMYNGVFHEISAYYNADDDLKKEELNTKVMDAGTIGEARYILPLRYDFPVILVDEDRLSEYGLKLEDVTNVQRLMDKFLELDDSKLAYSVNLGLLNHLYFFPDLVDYRTGETLLSEEKVAAYLRQYQYWIYLQVEEAFSDESGYRANSSITSYASANLHWGNHDYALHLENLTSVLHNTLIAKSLGKSYSMYPLRSSDDSLIAEITYWGAVGAGCEHPDVAYDFLREFLSQEAQWEQNRTKAAADISDSLYEDGVPVRNIGAIHYLGESIKNQTGNNVADPIEGSIPRDEALQNVTLDDSDIPVWEAEIDTVRFRHPLSWDQWTLDMEKSLNDFNNGYAPTDVDLDEMAKAFVKRWEYLMAEG